MLVLTRKSEQKIIIGKDIVITILRVCGDQVSVGIDAPKEMRIFREELIKERSEPVEKSACVENASSGRHHKSHRRPHKKPVVQEA